MSRTDHCRRPGSHTAVSRADRLYDRKPLVVVSLDTAPEPELADWERVLLEMEAECDSGETYADDDDEGVSEIAYGIYDHWLPYVSIEQARDIFCGGDFIVVRG